MGTFAPFLMPDNDIEQVDKLGKKQGAKAHIEFRKSHREKMEGEKEQALLIDHLS